MSTTRRRGHVKQRGDTFTAYWRSRSEDGRSVQRSKGGFATAVAAERHLTKILRDIDTGLYAEPDRKARAQTFAQFVRDDWLPTLKGSARNSTFTSYRDILELHVLPAVGGLRLREIGPDRLNELYAELLADGRRKGQPGGLSVTSVRYVHTVLRRVLRDAVRLNRVGLNPSDRATPPRAQRREMQVWSNSQLRTFLNEVRDDRLYCAWHLFITTGMRRGEVGGLRWVDVDLDAGQLSIRQTLIAVGGSIEISEPKTPRSRRRIGLDPATVAALRSWKAQQAQDRLAWGEAWTDSGFVFTREDGQPVSPQTWTHAFDRRARRAGLPTIRLHDLRHSYATAAIGAGVPTKVVSERLGHSGIAITSDTYQHVLPEVDEEAAARVAAAILG